MFSDVNSNLDLISQIFVIFPFGLILTFVKSEQFMLLGRESAGSRKFLFKKISKGLETKLVPIDFCLSNLRNKLEIKQFSVAFVLIGF